MGREWLLGGATLALVVPSAIVPHEANYVLNVNHPQFARLVATRAPFSFDDRLWRAKHGAARLARR